ncbi:hypothetical protein SLE2022_382220 [Rubroshorea leprosula]
MPKDRRVSSLSFDRSRVSPYPCSSRNAKQFTTESPSKAVYEFKEWEEAKCAICMEHPHNAVLLHCSSFEKGCQPYMCNTSYRHSNCLDQFCKSSVSSPSTVRLREIPPLRMTNASHNVREPLPQDEQGGAGGSSSQPNLVCPLCRGEVYGWSVVEPARRFMNSKARSCSCENCDFGGTYSELRKHARAMHPLVHPSEVDPARQRDWTRLEQERDYEDMRSSIQSAFGEDINMFWLLGFALRFILSFEGRGEHVQRSFSHDLESDRGTSRESSLYLGLCISSPEEIMPQVRHQSPPMRRAHPRWRHQNSLLERGQPQGRQQSSLRERGLPQESYQSSFPERRQTQGSYQGSLPGRAQPQERNLRERAQPQGRHQSSLLEREQRGLRWRRPR